MDVAIIGGGPAGSSAAIRLARLGLKVQLYERKRFPRRKLCGGFVSGEALADLKDLGVLSRLEGLIIRRIRITSSFGFSSKAPLPILGLSLPRAELDTVLLNAARESGAEVLEGREINLPSVHADWIVDARGRQAAPGPAHYGIQAMFEGQDLEDCIQLDFQPDGYVGRVQQAGGINVCALLNRSALRASQGDFDRLVGAGRRRQSNWQAVGPIVLGFHRLSEGRVLFAGDAACVVDPFVGEGITMAIRTSRCLASAFRQTQKPVAEAYAEEWHRTFDRVLQRQTVVRKFMAHRASQEMLIGTATLFPSILRTAAQATRSPYADH